MVQSSQVSRNVLSGTHLFCLLFAVFTQVSFKHAIKYTNKVTFSLYKGKKMVILENITAFWRFNSFLYDLFHYVIYYTSQRLHDD